MDTDNETEAGGQTEDTGDAGAEEADTGESETTERAAAEPGPSRRERRANRMREANEARERSERELGEMRQRYSQLESQLADMRQQQERDRQTAQQTDASKQAADRVADLREQAETYLIRANAKGIAPEEARRLLQRYYDLNDQANDLRAEMRDEANWKRRRGEMQQSAGNPEANRELAYFESKYPQLADNIEAQALAVARFDTLTKRQGMPANRATREAAITYALKQLGLGGQAAPGNTSRQAYEGRGARDGEADGGGGNETNITPEFVKNNLALRKMAEGSYRELPAEQAYAKFAKEYNAREKANGVSR